MTDQIKITIDPTLSTSYITMPYAEFMRLTAPVDELQQYDDKVRAECNSMQREGDELVNAFIRGFNFRATEGGSTKSKKFISGKDAYEAQCLDFPNATPWDGVAEDIQHRYRRIANELNKRLQAA